MQLQGLALVLSGWDLWSKSPGDSISEAQDVLNDLEKLIDELSAEQNYTEAHDASVRLRKVRRIIEDSHSNYEQLGQELAKLSTQCKGTNQKIAAAVQNTKFDDAEKLKREREEYIADLRQRFHAISTNLAFAASDVQRYVQMLVLIPASQMKESTSLSPQVMEAVDMAFNELRSLVGELKTRKDEAVQQEDFMNAQQLHKQIEQSTTVLQSIKAQMDEHMKSTPENLSECQQMEEQAVQRKAFDEAARHQQRASEYALGLQHHAQRLHQSVVLHLQDLAPERAMKCAQSEKELAMAKSGVVELIFREHQAKLQAKSKQEADRIAWQLQEAQQMHDCQKEMEAKYAQKEMELAKKEQQLRIDFEQQQMRKDRVMEAEVRAQGEVIARVMLDTLLAEHDQTIKITDWTAVLGRGSLGTVVYEGDWEGSKVAVKVLPQQFHDAHKVQKEIQLLLDAEHTNVVKYRAQLTKADAIWIAMELCPGGSVKDLYERGGSLPVDPINACSQLCSALQHIHNLGIIHADLKPGNVLLVKDQLKIADMGMAKRLDGDVYLASQGGTHGWQSPPVLHQWNTMQPSDTLRIGCEDDCFALGLLLFYVLSNGHHAFGDQMVGVDQRVLDNRHELTQLRCRQPTPVVEALSGLLAPQPQLRLTAVKAGKMLGGVEGIADESSELLLEMQEIKVQLNRIETKVGKIEQLSEASFQQLAAHSILLQLQLQDCRDAGTDSGFCFTEDVDPAQRAKPVGAGQRLGVSPSGATAKAFRVELEQHYQMIISVCLDPNRLQVESALPTAIRKFDCEFDVEQVLSSSWCSCCGGTTTAPDSWSCSSDSFHGCGQTLNQSAQFIAPLPKGTSTKVITEGMLHLQLRLKNGSTMDLQHQILLHLYPKGSLVAKAKNLVDTVEQAYDSLPPWARGAIKAVRSGISIAFELAL